jgi:hypothetical protein
MRLPFSERSGMVWVSEQPSRRQMPASTVIMMIVLASVTMFGPALIILRLPFVPNWPYTALACLVSSAVVGGVYTARVRRHLRKPSPMTPSWLVRVFPVWLSVLTLFWSSVRLNIEKDQPPTMGKRAKRREVRPGQSSSQPAGGHRWLPAVHGLGRPICRRGRCPHTQGARCEVSRQGTLECQEENPPHPGKDRRAAIDV